MPMPGNGRNTKRQVGAYLTPAVYRDVVGGIYRLNLTHQEAVGQGLNLVLERLGCGPSVIPSTANHVIRRGVGVARRRGGDVQAARRGRVYICGWFPAHAVAEAARELHANGLSLQRASELGLRCLSGVDGDIELPHDAVESCEGVDSCDAAVTAAPPAHALAPEGTPEAEAVSAVTRAVHEGLLEGAEELFASLA